jgi:hypothetical protein
MQTSRTTIQHMIESDRRELNCDESEKKKKGHKN